MADSATDEILHFRELLQPHIDGFLQRKLSIYTEYSDDPFLAALLAYPAKLAKGTGKRIRPYVAHLMYRANCDDEGDRIFPYLVALELFHLFCLVHDDVIDRGTHRYGMSTIQRFVAQELAKQDRPGSDEQHEHIATSQALLLGDLLFAWAQEAFYDNADFDGVSFADAQRYFRSMVDEIVVGQMIDVDMTAQRATSVEIIRRKLVLKTASYTFIRPMQIGCALAGRGKESESFCHEVGLALGIAFQLQDDLLDLVGTSEKTQKTLLSDLREHQHTFFTQYLVECGTEAEQAELQVLLGADLQHKDRARVMRLFASSGAIEAGRSAIRGYLEQARSEIGNSSLAPTHRERMQRFVEMMASRAPLDDELFAHLQIAPSRIDSFFLPIPAL